MSIITLSPVGKLVVGHVLDCRKGPLEAMLRRYDAQLYLRWNSRKLQGSGCWELRRRPENKTVKEIVKLGGMSIAVLEYREHNHVHHVKDFAYLNYKILEWVKDQDTWAKSYKAKDFAKDFEFHEQRLLDEQADKAADDRKYAIKQHKREIRGLMDYINSGGDPGQIVDNWK